VFFLLLYVQQITMNTKSKSYRDLGAQDRDKGLSYARRRALYDQGNHFTEMGRFADLTIEEIRIILRRFLNKAEIAEIEEQAVHAYYSRHPDMIQNPKTGRFVLRGGAIGKAILATRKKAMYQAARRRRNL
jgi:hypothetical protein